MRLRWQVFAVLVIFSATPSVAEPPVGRQFLNQAQNSAKAKAGHDDESVVVPPFSQTMTDNLGASARPIIFASNETKPLEPEIDIVALMSGKCSTLRIAGRDFACKSVVFSHSALGRTNFAIALDDPTDENHIISFSGEKGRREPDDQYELLIDQMLLNSKDRPKVYGLPVPFAELAAGNCKQLGNLAAGQVSSISCIAMDKNGKKYELQFESDGLPVTVRKVRSSPPTIRNPTAEPSFTQKLVEPNAVAPEYREAAEKRRAEQIAQLECRHKADLAKVLARDRTAHIIQCLAEFSEKPTTTARQ